MKQFAIKSSYSDYFYTITTKASLTKNNIHIAFYFLDGQNAFKDEFAVYHKSLKALRILDQLHKPYIAIAINSPNDITRFSMYTPFKLNQLGINNDTKFHNSFISDFTNLVLPCCEKGLNITKRYLISSSLATLPALELSSYFNGLALFSSAFFLDYNKTAKLIKPNNQTLNFIAVGEKEFSDGEFTNNDYILASQWYYNLCLKKHMPAKLVIWPKGKHDELSWHYYLKLFIKEIEKEL